MWPKACDEGTDGSDGWITLVAGLIVLVLGLTFVDPSTGGLESRLVGPAVVVECECNIADPDAPSLQQLDPSDDPSLGHAGR